MTDEELLVKVVAALEAAEMPYMVVGSLSTNYYGVARSTMDADLVIDVGDRRLNEIADSLGPPFQLDPQLSFESVTMTIRQIIHILDSPYKFELFHLSDDAHDQERFRRRQQRHYMGRSIWLPTAEDVVITKLNWYSRQRRNKDHDDVRDVLAVQGDTLDFDYIHSWCDRHGTRQLLDEIRASIPKID